ncbi:MAG: DUF1801 domain-containing protein [Microbacteriaceae bacterium]
MVQSSPTLAVRHCVQSVGSPRRRSDAETLLELFGRVTGEDAVMWGASIIGFGTYHYRYASGHQGDSAAAAFSPRTSATTIYLPDGVGAHAAALTALGPHRASVGCLYIANLEKINLSVVESIVATSYRTVTEGTFGHRAADSSE